jgi:CPSF A subunit region
VDFFQTLEMQLASQNPPLAGRDHLIYRSYYVPVKGVIDGDLCETFFLLANDKKQTIAGELDRSVREVERKISVCFSDLHRCEKSILTGVGYAYTSCLLILEDVERCVGYIKLVQEVEDGA